jgi:hypothetical protein
MSDINDYSDSDLFLNRELSQLEFNFRVLAQAQDPVIPLLERLKYLCISCTNLDEFFEIRAATVKTALQYKAPLLPDNMDPPLALDKISQTGWSRRNMRFGTRSCVRSWRPQASASSTVQIGMPHSDAGFITISRLKCSPSCRRWRSTRRIHFRRFSTKVSMWPWFWTARTLSADAGASPS